jgi:sulfate-transporting ATPase
MAQYVMSMLKVSKMVPPKRQIIKDISLSFFPGAKIGLLGLNGSGKSTVMKIMAGVDKEFDGEVQRLAGISIGYLEQEPHLDNTKTVREEVESAFGEIIAAQGKLEAVYMAYADENADFDALAEEQARLEAIISAGSGDNIEQQLEMAADALRLPPWDAVIGYCLVVKNVAWLCVSSFCLVPICCYWTNRPTIWMQSPWIGWSNFWYASLVLWSLLRTTVTF